MRVLLGHCRAQGGTWPRAAERDEGTTTWDNRGLRCDVATKGRYRGDPVGWGHPRLKLRLPADLLGARKVECRPHANCRAPTRLLRLKCNFLPAASPNLREGRGARVWIGESC